MICTITLRVDVATYQKATALRNRCVEHIEADADATFIAASSSHDQTAYTVTGVDTDTRAIFTETVNADNPQDAGSQVATDTRIVVTVAPASDPIGT